MVRHITSVAIAATVSVCSVLLFPFIDLYTHIFHHAPPTDHFPNLEQCSQELTTVVWRHANSWGLRFSKQYPDRWNFNTSTFYSPCLRACKWGFFFFITSEIIPEPLNTQGNIIIPIFLKSVWKTAYEERLISCRQLNLEGSGAH